MKFFTTFCPQKISWELTTISGKGSFGSNNWIHNIDLVNESLNTLQRIGIQGIRLVIFPNEITSDGIHYHWEAIDSMLHLCQKLRLSVILCIGPFQYPYYPGIYLPEKLLQHVFDNDNALDTNNVLSSYGIKFLENQMDKYAQDKRILGFHLANEWPDTQHVSGREQLRKRISEFFMQRTIAVIKQKTEKPVFLNTNIDAADKRKLIQTFGEILQNLGKQGNLGFDIYPSQEKWSTVPLQKLRRIIEPYQSSFKWSGNRFKPCVMYFAEVEAQPWGDGRSWYAIIQSENDPQTSILSYSTKSMENIWKNHINGTSCDSVSFWGSDFWLSAKALGVTWPLDQIKYYCKNY